MIKEKTTYSGLVYASDQIFLSRGSQVHDLKGVTISYDDIVSRITMDLDLVDPVREDVARRVRDAVWDTGSTTSVISEKTARIMGLQPVDKGVLFTAVGNAEVPIYIVDVVISKDLIIKNLKVFGSPMKDREMEFIIGMDIISRGKFLIENNNGITRVIFEI